MRFALAGVRGRWVPLPEEHVMPWTIVATLYVLWLLGLITRVGGGLIHLLPLAGAVVMFLYLLSIRRTVV